VSLRHKLSLRDVPSVVIPVLGAAALLSIPLALASVAVWGRAGLFWAAASLLLILALSALRTMRMTARGGISAALIPWAFAVALAYDLGRAVSLLLPARHRDRQRVEQPQARHSRS
jgi:hypothetical protein